MLLEVNRSIFRCKSDEQKLSMIRGSVGIAAVALILLNFLNEVGGSSPVVAAALKLQSGAAGSGLACGSTSSKDAPGTDLTRIPAPHSHDLQADHQMFFQNFSSDGILNETELREGGTAPSHPENGVKQHLTRSRGDDDGDLDDDPQLRADSGVTDSRQDTRASEADDSARHTGPTTRRKPSNRGTESNNGANAKLLSGQLAAEPNSSMMMEDSANARATNEKIQAMADASSCDHVDEEDSLSPSDVHHVERVFFRDEDITADLPLVRNVVACDLSKLSALKSDAVTVCGWKQAAGRLRWLEVGALGAVYVCVRAHLCEFCVCCVCVCVFICVILCVCVCSHVFDVVCVVCVCV